MLELGADSPFMRSVERRRPGGSMRAYVSRTLPHHSAIVVSNRAPHEPRPEGGFARGAGGVVTALLTLAEGTAADWVCCARTDSERKLVETQGDAWTAPLIRSHTRLHYVMPTREQYDQYYSVMANPVLWFVQHYLWDLAQQPIINGRIHRAWKDGYVEVNRQVAQKVVDVGRRLPHRPLVLVHDYQLYLVPKIVREQLPGAIIQHFIHIPWPTPQYWKVLPKQMRSAILEGLLGCDIVGFQSSLDVRNFLMTCEENAGLQGQVQFWAFLQPSRQDVAIYRTYLRRVRQVAARINSQYGGQGWMPIRLEFGENVRKAMAALRNFDVLLVNPVYDGLNLVVKEGAVVNRSEGMIVLSENAGAHEELQPHVISINPFDIEATADAIYQGLTMSAEERRKRNEAARDVVRTNDISRWITRQVQDIRDLVAVPGLRAGFASFTYGLTDFFLAPFHGLLPTIVSGKSVLELSVVFAILIYSLVALGLVRLVAITLSRSVMVSQHSRSEGLKPRSE